MSSHGPSSSPRTSERDAPQTYRRSETPPLPHAERRRVTVLFGGLTRAHERLIEGGWQGLGYTVKALPTADNQSLAIGKEFCSRGMCNPAYYTIGNLLKYLLQLRRAGVPEIEERFVYLTAGSCGPCRFGMYEAEYRRALAQAGFPRFRILLVQQDQGLEQNAAEGVFVADRDFLQALVRALMVGDLLNELGYALRPYEVEPGAIDAALAEGRRWLYWALRDRQSPLPALRRLRKRLDEVPIDYARVRPRVRIVGEFWAQTTEGDGNYHLARWLESEGAEVMVEPVGTWIEYLLWNRIQRSRARRTLPPEGGERHSPLLELKLRMGQILFDSVYNSYRAALGFRTEPIASLDTLARYAHEYFDTRIRGGEAFLEVAKTVFAVRHRRAHMVVSVKPFGCMPSTQSDGVQVRVVSDHPEALFIPVETSGDSEVHVKSRVQMLLFEARERATEEFDRVARDLGLRELLADAQARERLPMPPTMHPLPRRERGTAANYLWWLARPAALRTLPLPSERLTALLCRAGLRRTAGDAPRDAS
ncbi:MAG: 2-hydroxyglutaryl-CoA dehydratase [Candidatus Eisenbacteria bacterium]|nr:2-hydroxyglutaryl-CoA dehydratase [Candidatus Eisenbacteria bacterium]